MLPPFLGRGGPHKEILIPVHILRLGILRREWDPQGTVPLQHLLGIQSPKAQGMESLL